MTTMQRWGFAAFIVLAILFLSNLHTLAYPLITFLKPLPIYALLLIVPITPVPYVAKLLLMVALVLSSIGDIALTLPLSKQLELGLFSFLSAHLCYIGLYQHILKHEQATLMNPILFKLIGMAGLVCSGALMYVLWPHLGDKMIPVMLYMGVILIMTVFAARVNFYCTAGAILFVISDSIIAIDEFLNHAQNHFFAIMLTYYLAQCLLVIGLLQVLSRSHWRPRQTNDLDSAVDSV